MILTHETMINYKKLLNYLRRYWWLIVLVPALAVGTTYYFVRELPDTYASQAHISTGVSEAARMGSLQGVGYSQSRQFYSNLIGMMYMKHVVNAVSYQLILHDLQADNGRFRHLSELISAMGEQQRQEIIESFYRLQVSRSENPENGVDGLPLYDVLASMGYDYGGIMSGLSIFRVGDSDFITIRFVSENPDLSAFVVNSFATAFIHDYQSSTRDSDLQSVATLDSLVKEKERVMQEKNEALRDYRISSGILSSSTQSGMLYSQIASLEAKRSDKLAEIESLQGTIAGINAQLSSAEADQPTTRRSNYHNEIVMIDQQLEQANRRYIDNNFSPADKRVVDSLQQERKAIVASAVVSGTSTSPTINRPLLQQQLTELKMSLSIARNSIGVIEADLASARGRYSAMVPKDAGLQNYERDAELATNAYLEALNRYNQAGYVSSVETPMRIIEQGMPGGPMPSKKIIYTGLSGIASMMMCVFGVLVMGLLDRTISTPEELEFATKSKNIAVLNRISKNGSPNSVQKIWKESVANPEYASYRDQLRTLRFDLQQDLLAQNYQIIGVTGFSENEGKSFVTGSLAYAFALTGKKVLIIGEDISVLVKEGEDTKSEAAPDRANGAPQEFERFLIEREIQAEDLITNLQRNVENTSILEVQDRKQLISGFNLLKEKFDLILIDIGSFSNINHVKEWLLFSDVSIAVFEAGRAMPRGSKGYMELLKDHPGFKGWILNKA